jgi:hypothetical protein
MESEKRIKELLHARKGQQSGARLAAIELAAEDITYRKIKSEALALVRKIAQLCSELSQMQPMNFPTDKDDIALISSHFFDAIHELIAAHHLLESTGLSKRYSALFTAACDALNATSAAIEHCDDEPDQ